MSATFNNGSLINTPFIPGWDMSEFSDWCIITNSVQNKQFSPPTIEYKLLKSSFHVQTLSFPTQSTAKHSIICNSNVYGEFISSKKDHAAKSADKLTCQL